MTDAGIYRDIANRTGGDIYIGVVGPVRTGKSTFIKKFMENQVIPNIEKEYDRARARDEMPQSAAGRTVMTTEPKFIPDEAVEIVVGDNARMRVKMIDCVGYIVPEAMGHMENGVPRMVRTPWSADPMPFEQAAEIGTRKVICEHSTIGLVVTTDGTVGDIPRENYTEAEGRVIRELKELNKPFAIVVNSADPGREESRALACRMEEDYGVPVALVNCLEMDSEDVRHILELVLLEFPVQEVGVGLPSWICALDEGHWLRASLEKEIMTHAAHVSRVGEVGSVFGKLVEMDAVRGTAVESIDLGSGCVRVAVSVDDSLYYRVLGELTGLTVENQESMIPLMMHLAEIKNKYDKISAALDEVRATGYGIVTPDIEDLHLEEPEIVRQAGGYGVRLKASAPSIHMIRADIETEINPMVGTEQQSEDLVRFLLHEFEEDPRKIWESNIFGKTLHELVNEGLHTKLSHMPSEARLKLGETLQRIINEGSGGLICILL